LPRVRSLLPSLDRSGFLLTREREIAGTTSTLRRLSNTLRNSCRLDGAPKFIPVIVAAKDKAFTERTRRPTFELTTTRGMSSAIIRHPRGSVFTRRLPRTHTGTCRSTIPTGRQDIAGEDTLAGRSTLYRRTTAAPMAPQT